MEANISLWVRSSQVGLLSFQLYTHSEMKQQDPHCLDSLCVYRVFFIAKKKTTFFFFLTHKKKKPTFAGVDLFFGSSTGLNWYALKLNIFLLTMSAGICGGFRQTIIFRFFNIKNASEAPEPHYQYHLLCQLHVYHKPYA